MITFTQGGDVGSRVAIMPSMRTPLAVAVAAATIVLGIWDSLRTSRGFEGGTVVTGRIVEVVVVAGSVGSGTIVVVGVTEVVVLTGAGFMAVVLAVALLEGPCVNRAVTQRLASATMATMATIIQPVSSGFPSCG